MSCEGKLTSVPSALACYRGQASLDKNERAVQQGQLGRQISRSPQGIKNQSPHSGMWKNVIIGKDYEQKEVAGSSAWCPL